MACSGKQFIVKMNQVPTVRLIDCLCSTISPYTRMHVSWIYISSLGSIRLDLIITFLISGEEDYSIGDLDYLLGHHCEPPKLINRFVKVSLHWNATQKQLTVRMWGRIVQTGKLFMLLHGKKNLLAQEWYMVLQYLWVKFSLNFHEACSPVSYALLNLDFFTKLSCSLHCMKS